jgi:alcohol dehydrogenase class IV
MPHVQENHVAYTVHCPTRIIFSDGARADLERELAGLPAGPALVVTDPGIVSAGILERVLPEIGNRTLEAFGDVPGNPGVATVAEALEKAQACGAQAIVAIGGGSAIDAAKAVGVLLAHPGVTWEQLQAGRAALSGRRVPLIAVPTTAGTGSEVSHVAVIGAPDGFKKGVVHPSLFPSVAIVDPGLTLSLPPSLTAATGMDTVVHALEAYLGRRANPSMDLLALGALERAVDALPAAVEDGANLGARRDMAYAAVWAGMAMDQAGLGLCHALCGPLSARRGVHHGLGNALLLPAVLAFDAPAIASDRWPRLRHALGLRETAQPGALAGWARAFVVRLGMPAGLAQVGVEASDLPAMAADATRMAMIGNNVRPASEADCLAVLRATL